MNILVQHEPVVTLSIPYVSGVDYLKRTLDSVFRQESDAWTAILVDNSRTSEAREQARALVKQYDAQKLRYVENDEHLVVCDNFNRCIDLAQTDLVTILHSDDELLPNFVGDISRLASHYPAAAVVFTAACIIGPDSKPRFSFADWIKRFTMPRGQGDLVLRDESDLNSLLRGCWINGAALSFRKSRLGPLRWNSALKMSGDLDLWSRLLISGRTLAGARRPPAYAYRRHATQATASMGATLYRFREEAHVYDIIASRCEGAGWMRAARTARAKRIIRLHIAYAFLSDVLRGSFGRSIDKLRLLGQLDRPVSADPS